MVISDFACGALADSPDDAGAAPSDTTPESLISHGAADAGMASDATDPGTEADSGAGPVA